MRGRPVFCQKSGLCWYHAEVKRMSSGDQAEVNHRPPRCETHSARMSHTNQTQGRHGLLQVTQMWQGSCLAMCHHRDLLVEASMGARETCGRVGHFFNFSLGESPLHYLDLLAISRSGFVMSASFTMFTFPPPGRGFSTTWSWKVHFRKWKLRSIIH